MNFVLPPFREFGTLLSACFALVAYAEIKEGVRVGDIVVAHAGTSLQEGGEVSTTLADEAGPVEQNSWL